MISIRHSVAELEQAHQERMLTLDCYHTAIRNIAHYAVELDSQITEPHRQYLNALADELAAGGPEFLRDSRATLRGLLRDYRDKASEYLNQLREELSGTARALEEILDSLSQADGDHETKLRNSLLVIHDIAQSPHAAAIRDALRSAAGLIENSLDQIRKQHQLAIAQFQVEIRMLHKRIDALEAASSIDQLTHMFNRGEIEERIRSASTGYSLLLMRLSGFRAAEVHYSQEVAAELAGAFAKRLRNSLPPNATVGRWQREQFIAMLDIPNGEAMALAKWISEHLGGAYACLQGGKTVRPSIQLTVGVIDSVGCTPARVMDKVLEYFPE
jgi:GGDEF domain-containing protein